MPDYEALILQYQEAIEAGEDCSGDCDYCPFKVVEPSTAERIDREPHFYCSLFDDV